MAFLGTPYRLAYEAKNFRSGLADILAMVLRPDGSLAGPLSMTELVQAGFAGVYACQFASSTSDPEGEYLAAIISPTDGIRDLHRFTLQIRPTVASAPFMPFISATIPDQATVAGEVGSSAIIGEVPNTSSALEGSVGQSTLEGEIPGPSGIDGTIPGEE